MNAHGIVHKYGDHVDTDVIIPARYLNTQSHKELASHCMEDIDKDFIHRVKDGDIMVAGVNFGCGCVTANYDGIKNFRSLDNSLPKIEYKLNKNRTSGGCRCLSVTARMYILR